VSSNPERDELLRAIVAADLALRPERQRLRVQRLESHAGQIVMHPGFNDRDWRECNRQDIEDLYAQGLIRLEKKKRPIQIPGAPRTYSEEWFFDVTDAGLQKIEREQRAAAQVDAPEGGSGGYDWETEALPVLQAVYTASASADVDLGVSHKTLNEVLGRQPNDPQTDRIVTMLVQGDYLERTAFEAMGSWSCQITERLPLEVRPAPRAMMTSSGLFRSGAVAADAGSPAPANAVADSGASGAANLRLLARALVAITVNGRAEPPIPPAAQPASLQDFRSANGKLAGP
jgi:hypothetical protein